MAPSSLGDPQAARRVLEDSLMRYSSELRGFVVAFSGARFSPSGRYGTSGGVPLGRIVAEQPVVHVHLEAEVLLFRPARGQVLEGVVNRVAPYQVSCLVAGMFNASISASDMAGGYSYVEGGAGAWKSTPLRQQACEWERAEAEGKGSSSSSSSSSKARARQREEGRNELLAANPDTIEVGQTILFRVSDLQHSAGVLYMKGVLTAH